MSENKAWTKDCKTIEGTVYIDPLPVPSEAVRQQEATCKWTLGLTEEELWRTDCGQLYQFTEGATGPRDCCMAFCHYCGKPLQEVVPGRDVPVEDGAIQKLEQAEDLLDRIKANEVYARFALEYVREALALLRASAAPPQTGWRTIASAPKDEKRVLLFNPDEHPYGWELQTGAYYEQLGGWQYDGQMPSYSNAHPPTHWMPLPDPPAPVSSSDQEKTI